MVSLRQYAYGIGFLLFVVGIVLIPFSGGVLTLQSAILIGVGAALIIGAYFYTWFVRHPFAAVIVVVIVLILLYVLLPFLGPITFRQAPAKGAVVEFPAANDAAGTNCEVSDLGSWSNRTSAHQDDDPNADATSARAEGDPVGAPCDDWIFNFDLPDLPITRVQVTFEWAVESGTAQMRVGPFSSSPSGNATTGGPTECEAQSTSVTQGPSAYTVETFDFTGCKDWVAFDFNNNAFGVSMEILPQVTSVVFMDYVKVTVTQEGTVAVAGEPAFTFTEEVRDQLALILGAIALIALVIALMALLLRLPRRVFRSSLALFIIFGLAWAILTFRLV